MRPRSSALQPWRRIALCIAAVARAGSLGGVDEFMHRCHAGLSSVAGKQQAWDVRKGELNFD
jgi:hypothetical protein